jgi:hypothetical protein
LSVTVTLSQSQIEKLLGIIVETERGLLEARTILTLNASVKQPRTSPSQGISLIDGVKWRVKGRGSAIPSDDFAFDFVFDREGTIAKDKIQIVHYIKEKCVLRAEDYEITLSKDGKFLPRIRV